MQRATGEQKKRRRGTARYAESPSLRSARIKIFSIFTKYFCVQHKLGYAFLIAHIGNNAKKLIFFYVS